MTKKWNSNELDEFKKIILKKRDVVIKDIEKTKLRLDDLNQNNESISVYSSHMADAGSEQQDKESAYYNMQRESKFLGYLDRALLMIDDGSFGVCVSCNDKINKDRLLEVPHTTKCFDCKTNL
tara:strand:+ start:768 stop:1136 length:369 start_codon:yes stop_codon:yes gene_type:complete